MKTIIADSESTGTGDDARVIEAAWLYLPETPGEFLEVRQAAKFPHFHKRYSSPVPIELGAMATHNIIPEDLEGLDQWQPDELDGDATYMIGHNIDFDFRMFGGPDVKLICTLALSRWLFPELDSHKQSAMIYHIGREMGRLAWARDLVKGAHAALDDVRMCAILLRYLIKTMDGRGFTLNTWEQVYQASQTARIPTVMGFGKWKGMAIADVPSDYVRWYRGTDDQDPWLLEAFKRAGK